MKNVLLIVLSIIVASILWSIVSHLLVGLFATVFNIAMIALFCYVVYYIYRLLSRQKV